MVRKLGTWLSLVTLFVLSDGLNAGSKSACHSQSHCQPQHQQCHPASKPSSKCQPPPCHTSTHCTPNQQHPGNKPPKCSTPKPPACHNNPGHKPSQTTGNHCKPSQGSKGHGQKCDTGNGKGHGQKCDTGNGKGHGQKCDKPTTCKDGDKNHTVCKHPQGNCRTSNRHDQDCKDKCNKSSARPSKSQRLNGLANQLACANGLGGGLGNGNGGGSGGGNGSGGGGFNAGSGLSDMGGLSGGSYSPSFAGDSYSPGFQGSDPVADQEPDDNTAWITLELPTFNARVVIDDINTTAVGQIRKFVTPQLDGNTNYANTVRITWLDKAGKLQSHVKTFQFTAGDEIYYVVPTAQQLTPINKAPMPKVAPK